MAVKKGAATATFLLIGAALVLAPVAGQAAYDAVYDLTLSHPDTLGELVDSVHDGVRGAQGKGQGIEFDDVVRIYKNGEEVAKVHNALMEGENIIRNQSIAGDGTTARTFDRNWTAISLGNGTSPTDASTSLAKEVGDTQTGTGFSPNTSTDVELIDSDGGDHTDGIEWNVTAKFTSQATTTLNTTALVDHWPGAHANIDYFAGADFGRSIPFEPDDTLTVEWNVDPD